MPFLSFLKTLVAGSDAPQQAETCVEGQRAQQTATADEANGAGGRGSSDTATESAPTTPRPPPPPPPMASKMTGLGTSSASSSSVRPGMARTESSATVYRDFTGTGHADGGHWNDPPSAVFKQAGGDAAEGFTLVDGAATPNGSLVAETRGAEGVEAEIPAGRADREALVRSVVAESLDAADAAADADADAMARKVAGDTRRRLAVLVDERLALADDLLVAQLSRLCWFVQNRRFADALGVHRAIIRTPGYDAESRWLVGVKRMVELAQKDQQAA